MTKAELDIIPFTREHIEGILELSLRAWAPVFPLMKEGIQNYVYDAFYPEGWRARQKVDIEACCLDDETDIHVAMTDAGMAGYVGLRVHPEDSMGEVYVIAVDPACQRQGVGAALLAFAFDWMRERDLAMAMVETGGDEGHTPARATYEAVGFARYPVARYFRKL